MSSSVTAKLEKYLASRLKFDTWCPAVSFFFYYTYYKNNLKPIMTAEFSKFHN